MEALWVVLCLMFLCVVGYWATLDLIDKRVARRKAASEARALAQELRDLSGETGGARGVRILQAKVTTEEKKDV